MKGNEDRGSLENNTRPPLVCRGGRGFNHRRVSWRQSCQGARFQARALSLIPEPNQEDSSRRFARLETVGASG